MLALVTGSTGLVGNNVTRLLLDRGESVRVLVRANADRRPLEGLAVESVVGDIRDSAALHAACQGVDCVIHAAARVHIGRKDLEEQRAVNVQGSRNVAEAAQAADARMVYVSSVDALGVGSQDVPANEDTPREGKFPCTYVISKHEAEDVVLNCISDGLDGVVVNPGFMLGPWDWKPSSGRMLLEVATRFTPAAPIGGCTVCDVRDVADGILAAVSLGKTGRRYILGGHNITYFDLWCLFAEVTGCGKPRFRLGPLMRWLGGTGGDLVARITGREPDVNSAAIGMSSQFHYYSSARAEQELGYHVRPTQESIADAWKWFQDHDYV